MAANLGEELALEVCPPTCEMGIPIWSDQIASKQVPVLRHRMAAITGLERDGNPARMRRTLHDPSQRIWSTSGGRVADGIAQFVEL